MSQWRLRKRKREQKTHGLGVTGQSPLPCPSPPWPLSGRIPAREGHKPVLRGCCVFKAYLLSQQPPAGKELQVIRGCYRSPGQTVLPEDQCDLTNLKQGCLSSTLGNNSQVCSTSSWLSGQPNNRKEEPNSWVRTPKTSEPSSPRK